MNTKTTLKKLITVFVVLNILDFILSGLFLTSKTELNPLTARLWSQFGYSAVFWFKLCSVICFVCVMFLYHTKNQIRAICVTAFAVGIYTLVVLMLLQVAFYKIFMFM